MPRCPPEGRAVSARLWPQFALSSQQGFCARLVRPRLKRSCDHSLRGNTFSGYKFDNKLPPAQSPKMMIVRERPHSRTELPALRIPFGNPRLPRTECRAHPVSSAKPSPYHACTRARVPPRSRRQVPTRNEAGVARKVECGREGERIRTEKIGFLGRKICK